MDQDRPKIAVQHSPELGRLAARPLPRLADAPRLRRRLYLLAIAAVAAVPVLLFAAALAYDDVLSERTALEDRLWRASREALAAVEKELASHVAALEAISVFLDRGDGSDLDGLRDSAVARLRERHGWRLVRLVDARTLTVLASMGEPGREMRSAPPTREEIAAVVTGGRPWATILARGTTAGLPEIAIRVPVWRDGRVEEVLSAKIEAAIFSELLTRSAIPAEWTAAAIDPTFRIAGRNRAAAEFLGTTVTGSLRSEIEQATEKFFFASNKEGERVYTLFTRSPRSGWTVAIGAPAEVVEAPLLWSQLSVAGAGGGAILIAGLLAVFLVRNFERRQTAEERLAAVAAEAELERRLTEIARNLPGVIYRRVLHPDGSVSYPFVSSGAERLFSLPEAGLRQPMSPEELMSAVRYERADELHEEMLRSARELTPFEIEGPVRTPQGGTRWIRSMALPHRRADGSVAWDGVILDITAERRAEEDRELLVAELDHRVRNILAVVQGLASLTLPRSEIVEVYRGRVRALAQAHNLLAETRWVGASLRRLAETELAPYRGSPDGSVVAITGDEVLLIPAAAQALALSLHELATNATKHGALSSRGGRLELGWTIETGDDATRRLRLVWKESGGPPTTEPSRRGFGRELVERSVQHSLGGRITFEFRQEGLCCVIELPLERVTRTAR